MAHSRQPGAPPGSAKLNADTSLRTGRPLRASCTDTSPPAQHALNGDAETSQPDDVPAIFVRAERPVSPLQTWRLRGALALQECFDELEAEGHEIYTKRGLAARCGVDEKIVRKWCKAEKTIPAASLALWWPALTKRWLRKMGVSS